MTAVAALASDGDAQARADAVRRALALDPDNAQLWRDYAYALLETDAPDRDVLAVARRAIRLDPDPVRGHVLLGDLALGMNRPRRAAREFAAALELDRDDADARRGLAEAQRRRGELGASVRAAHELLAQHPDDAHALTLLRTAVLAALVRAQAVLWVLWLALTMFRGDAESGPLLWAVRVGLVLLALAAILGGVGRFGREAGLTGPLWRSTLRADVLLAIVVVGTTAAAVLLAAAGVVAPTVSAGVQAVALAPLAIAALVTAARWALR